MRQYQDGGYQVTEYDNGATVRQLISQPAEETPPIEIPLSEAQQRELDHDELLIDLLTQQQMILLELQTVK